MLFWGSRSWPACSPWSRASTPPWCCAPRSRTADAPGTFTIKLQPTAKLGEVEVTPVAATHTIAVADPGKPTVSIIADATQTQPGKPVGLAADLKADDRLKPSLKLVWRVEGAQQALAEGERATFTQDAPGEYRIVLEVLGTAGVVPGNAARKREQPEHRRVSPSASGSPPLAFHAVACSALAARSSDRCLLCCPRPPSGCRAQVRRATVSRPIRTFKSLPARRTEPV